MMTNNIKIDNVVSPRYYEFYLFVSIGTIPNTSLFKLEPRADVHLKESIYLEDDEFFEDDD